MIETGQTLVAKTLDELKSDLSALTQSLKPAHLKFAKALANGATLEDAYVAYGGKGKRTNFRSLGSQLLSTNPNIQDFLNISKMIASKTIVDGLEITEERIMKELACLGFYTVKDIYDDEGRLLMPHQMSDNTARAVTKVKETVLRTKVKNNEDGSETVEEETIRREYELADKKGALQLLGNSRSIQMFREHKVIDKGLDSLIDELTGGDGR